MGGAVLQENLLHSAKEKTTTKKKLKLGRNFTFQKDSEQCGHVKVQNCIQLRICGIVWKYIWKYCLQSTKTTNLKNLNQICQEEWAKNRSQRVCSAGRKLNRLKAVIEAKGSSTKLKGVNTIYYTIAFFNSVSISVFFHLFLLLFFNPLTNNDFENFALRANWFVILKKNLKDLFV